MNRLSLNHFYQPRRGTNPGNPLKRNYADYVNQLLEETKTLFEKKLDKETFQEKNEELKEVLSTKRVKMSYKKYTIEQKTKIIELADYMTPLEIEKKFGVDEATTRSWLKNGVKLDQRQKNGKKSRLRK